VEAKDHAAEENLGATNVEPPDRLARSYSSADRERRNPEPSQYDCSIRGVNSSQSSTAVLEFLNPVGERKDEQVAADLWRLAVVKSLPVETQFCEAE